MTEMPALIERGGRNDVIVKKDKQIVFPTLSNVIVYFPDIAQPYHLNPDKLDHVW